MEFTTENNFSLEAPINHVFSIHFRFMYAVIHTGKNKPVVNIRVDTFKYKFPT